MPAYCSGCNMLGHSVVSCSKKHLDTPLINGVAQLAEFHARTLSARRNASKSPLSSNLTNSRLANPHTHPVSIPKHTTHLSSELPIMQTNLSSAPRHSVQASSSSLMTSKPLDLILVHPNPPHKPSKSPLTSPPPPHNPTPTSSVPPTTTPPPPPSSHSEADLQLVQETGFHAADSGHNQINGTGGDRSIECRTDSLNQPTIQSTHAMPVSAIADGTPSACQNAETGPSDPKGVTDEQPHISVASEHQQTNIEANKALWEAVNRQVTIIEQARLTAPSAVTRSNNKNQFSKAKSITTKPSDVGNSTSLSQQRSAALEQFNSKVMEQSRIRDLHPTSVNHFQAPRDDHSEADDELGSYYSDTDDGWTEPIEMGYQSASGHSSRKLSGLKINKRHPNMPLNVRLRSRKNSHPSTP